ncbi:MAG TPA: site-2 protease family protein [Myxococcales bacterium]|jgi:Zn-dependent protease|nr:site-2 protease family protein [Myxococcales bacterium]
MTAHDLWSRVALLVPVLFGLTVHEWAHAAAALHLGDDTAERQGRLTLNPLAHIDPVGTLLLPLLGIPFGWAKPVPVEPNRFRPEVSLGQGLVLTAVAGPMANIVLALICAAALRLLPVSGSMERLLLVSTRVNLGLAVFNLLPVPPLDGSRIVDGFLPYEWRSVWNRFSQFGFVVLLALFFAPMLFGAGVADWTGPLSRQLTGR